MHMLHPFPSSDDEAPKICHFVSFRPDYARHRIVSFSSCLEPKSLEHDAHYASLLGLVRQEPESHRHKTDTLSMALVVAWRVQRMHRMLPQLLL